jgi:hypothetical protein
MVVRHMRTMRNGMAARNLQYKSTEKFISTGYSFFGKGVLANKPSIYETRNLIMFQNLWLW